MKKLFFLFGLSVLLIYGCSEESVLSTDTSPENFTQQDSRVSNRVIHHASAGGNDICEALGQPPGCDANFSLVANMREGGAVSGQWNDTFSGGGNGIHVTIDCMKVVDNWAIVSGIDASDGFRYVTLVVDNGTSNNDPPDQISFSFPFDGGDCTELDISDFDGFIFDLTRGQVKVW